MTEFITRHGELLTIVSVTDDPVYQDEPYVQSTTYQIETTATTAMETCNGSSFAENGGTNRHHVPHFLPGQNADARAEWLQGCQLDPGIGCAWRREDHVSRNIAPR